MRVMQYPDLDLPRAYPALGPPTVDDKAASVAVADVNGLATSIELYPGRDVLTDEGGHLYPRPVDGLCIWRVIHAPLKCRAITAEIVAANVASGRR